MRSDSRILQRFEGTRRQAPSNRTPKSSTSMNLSPVCVLHEVGRSQVASDGRRPCQRGFRDQRVVKSWEIAGNGRFCERYDAHDKMGSNLKSFDFVVYRPEGTNLLVDVKGRKLSPKNASLQNWVTREDIDDLRQWQEIFGDGFAAVFLFMYHWPERAETSPLNEMMLHQEKWYGMLAISVEDYREFMKPRSEVWGTVHLPAKEFRRMAKPIEEWL